MLIQKSIFKLLPLFILLCFGFALPRQVHADPLLPMGSVCTRDGECISDDCENGDDGKAYCDCDDDNDCSAQFNVQDGEQWTCKDDGPNDIDYCVSNLPGRTPAAFGGKPSNTDILLDPQLAGNEIKQMTNKPVLKINIPGLNFSKPQVTQGDDGGTYIQIPLIGEYIKAVYRYGIAAAGVVAVVIIINAGFLWIRSAGSAEVIQQQKQSIEKAVIGLIIAVASYTILFAINPKLTEFQNLKVQYIPPDLNIAGDHGEVDMSVDGPVTLGGGAQADCSTYPATRKGMEQCRKDCVANLPAEKKSNSSGAATDLSMLGYLDCSSIKGERPLSSIQYIGIHEGRVNGGPAWWWLQYLEKGAGRAYGTHYFVSRDGTISQAVDEKFIVWHGVKNANSIGIDLDAGCSSASGSDKVSKTCGYTEEQYNSIKALINSIVTRTNVKYDDDHILGHCQASTDASKGHIDPRNFDWSKINLKNENHRGVRCLYAM